MSQPTGTSGKRNGAADGDVKEKSKSRKVRKSNPAKVRVKLPAIESYQKEVQFRLDGPGRVVVRLERLMGSDIVRLTDAKFMITLLERLEEEENLDWTKRTKSRKKAERNRSRQLAIEGLMEPASDMQDLYSHPVFRVNRVLKRLAHLDQTMTQGQELHLPPIEQIEPFKEDESGAYFKSYPGHTSTKHGDLSELGSRADLYAELQGVTLSEELRPSYLKKEDEVAGEEPEAETGKKYEEYEGEGASEGEPEVTPSGRRLGPDASLSEMQRGYGIQPDEDLTGDWEPFRSHLVDLVFTDDDTDIIQLYEMAEEVLGVYKRENETADDYIVKLNRLH